MRKNSIKTKGVALKMAALSLLPLSASAQEKINKDSIYSLPTKEIYKYMRAAHNRQLIIEFDTLKLTEQNMAFVDCGGYDRTTHSININHLVADDKRLQPICNRFNAISRDEILTHESDHALKYKIENVAGLSLDEMTQYFFHIEISARIAVLRKSTKNIDDAVLGAITELGLTIKSYQGEEVPRLLENNILFSYLFQSEYTSDIRNNVPREQLKNFHEVLGDVYTFDNKNILNDVSPNTYEKLFKHVKQYSADTTLRNAIKKLSEKYAALVEYGNNFRTQYFQMLILQSQNGNEK